MDYPLILTDQIDLSLYVGKTIYIMLPNQEKRYKVKVSHTDNENTFLLDTDLFTKDGKLIGNPDKYIVNMVYDSNQENPDMILMNQMISQIPILNHLFNFFEGRGFGI